MPIYEYVCQDCGSKFEKLVRLSTATNELACPSCGNQRLERALSTFAAHSGQSASDGPGPGMCPGGGVCPTPGMCGLD